MKILPMGDIKLMKGNEAFAEAAIRSGCDAYFGYPITPQSEVMNTLPREPLNALGWYFWWRKVKWQPSTDMVRRNRQESNDFIFQSRDQLMQEGITWPAVNCPASS
jgi:hypothetical protein